MYNILNGILDTLLFACCVLMVLLLALTKKKQSSLTKERELKYLPGSSNIHLIIIQIPNLNKHLWMTTAFVSRVKICPKS